MAKKGKRRLTYFEVHKNKKPPYILYMPSVERYYRRARRMHVISAEVAEVINKCARIVLEMVDTAKSIKQRQK